MAGVQKKKSIGRGKESLCGLAEEREEGEKVGEEKERRVGLCGGVMMN